MTKAIIIDSDALIALSLTSDSNHNKVDEEIQIRAGQIFDHADSKKNTPFDAIIASCTEHLGADIIFSFDSWYTKLGFKLAG